MKNCENQEVEFQMVIRPIPGTYAYSVALGEIVNGQFQVTGRCPANFVSDFTCVNENPLAPGQKYVSAGDLNEVIGPLALEWESCVILAGFLVFSVKDIPSVPVSTWNYENSSKKEE